MRNVDREADPETALRSLKDLGGKMTECKRWVTALLVSVLSFLPCTPRVVAHRTAPPSLCCAVSCSLIREFEKEARADGQEANAVQRKKTVRLRLLLAPGACPGWFLWPTWGKRRAGLGEGRALTQACPDARPLPACSPPFACQDLVNQLNKFVAQKKKKTEELETKKVLPCSFLLGGP
jgi:hypothetical protein